MHSPQPVALGRPNDPSGILSRVPELEPLADEPSIRRAIERGKPHGVYRALFWANLLRRTGANAEVARTLLADRRLFLEPLRGAPTMATMNGVGTMVYGRDEQRPDGAYVTTLFLVLIFVPVLPLAAYLVADGGGRSYRFFGKAPLGAFTYAWSRLAMLGVLGAVLLGVGSTFWASRHATLHLVNGLPFPVVARVAGAEISVPPEGHAQAPLEVGTYPLSVRTLDGRLLEEQALEVRAGEDVLAFNVLGAAPIYRESVVYAASSYAPPSAEPDVGCGNSVIHWGSVDYAFVEPPRSMSLSSSHATETRTHADVVPGGWRICASVLASRGRIAEALALSTRVAEASDFATEVVLTALAFDDGSAAAEVLAMLDRARAAHPEVVELHRVYQTYAIRDGRRDEVRADYDARALASPESADLAYLAARPVPGPDGLLALEQVAARFPEHGYARRAHAYALWAAGRCAESLTAWDAAVALDADTQGSDAPRAACLVRLGRGGEALALLDREVDETVDPVLRTSAALLYASAALAVGAANPSGPIRRIDFTDAGPSAQIHAMLEARLPIEMSRLSAFEGEERDLLELLAVAALDPDRALALAEALSPTAVRQLPPELSTLLFAEAVRRDPSSVAAAHLRAGSLIGRVPTVAVARFVTSGEASIEIDDLYPPVRAGVWLARARAETDPVLREALTQRALDDDALSQWAAAAAVGWPAP